LTIAFAGLMILGLNFVLNAHTNNDYEDQRYYGSKYRDSQRYRHNDYEHDSDKNYRNNYGKNYKYNKNYKYDRHRYSRRSRNTKYDRYRNYKYRRQHFSRHKIRRIHNEIARNEQQIYKLERRINKLLHHHQSYRYRGRHNVARKIEFYEREIDELFYRNLHLKRLIRGSRTVYHRRRF
jgi:hypothetical protein